MILQLEPFSSFISYEVLSSHDMVITLPRRSDVIDRDPESLTLDATTWSTLSHVVVTVHIEDLYFAPQVRSQCS